MGISEKWHSARGALGEILAPLAWNSSRLFGSKGMKRLSKQLDPSSLRTMRDALGSDMQARAIFDQLLIAAELVSQIGEPGASVVKNRFSNCNGQFLQDIVALLLTNEKRNGFFVEVGVGDGHFISNTLMLERDQGWSGILVEPCKSFHKSIRAARSAKLDIRAATSDGVGQIEFEEDLGNGEFSSVAVSQTTTTGKSRYLVDSAKLTDILDDNDAPAQIDFLSIDTEGSEIAILNGLDFARYQFSMLAIEHNHVPGKLAALRKLLEPHGYRQILPLISKMDVWFAGPDVHPKAFEAIQWKLPPL